MNRTVFSLPDKSEFRTASGLAITRMSEQFTGDARRLDSLINVLDRQRGVVLSGHHDTGRYKKLDLALIRRWCWKRPDRTSRLPR
jgi:anthranilate synthase